MRLLRNYKRPQLQANWGRKVSVCFHQTYDRGLIMWWQAVSCAEFSQADPLLWSPLFSPGEVHSSSRDPCPWSSGHTQNDKSCFFRNFWMSSRARSIKLLSFHRMNKSLSLQPNPHWECFPSVPFPLHPIHMKRPVTGANGGEFLTCPPIYSPQRAGQPNRWVLGHTKICSIPRRACVHSVALSSVQFSRSVMSDSLRPHGRQHTRLTCPSPTPGACSNSRPSSQWCHPTISSSVVLFSSCLQSFPASGSFPMSQFFVSGGQILELQLHHQSFQWIFRTDLLWDWLAWSPCSPRDSQKSCSPRDSQESSPTPQFKSINFSVLSFLYGPTLTSIHDYWKSQPRLDQPLSAK